MGARGLVWCEMVSELDVNEGYDEGLLPSHGEPPSSMPLHGLLSCSAAMLLRCATGRRCHSELRPLPSPSARWIRHPSLFTVLPSLFYLVSVQDRGDASIGNG